MFNRDILEHRHHDSLPVEDQVTFSRQVEGLLNMVSDMWPEAKTVFLEVHPLNSDDLKIKHICESQQSRSLAALAHHSVLCLFRGWWLLQPAAGLYARFATSSTALCSAPARSTLDGFESGCESRWRRHLGRESKPTSSHFGTMLICRSLIAVLEAQRLV